MGAPMGIDTGYAGEQQFKLPRLLDFAGVMVSGSVVSLGIWAFVAAIVALLLQIDRMTVYIGMFLLWRCSYNIGIGALLYAQSRSAAFTRFYQRLAAKPGYDKIVQWVMTKYMADAEYDPNQYPAAFNAWVLFRILEDIIMTCDPVCYLLVVYKTWTIAPEMTLGAVLQYAAGVLLLCFWLWAKYDAHRTVGLYAWYWGDFFFRVEQHLTFEGIFELFPHPMYTVGYSVYYGLTLLSRSYTALFVSLCAHTLQVLFLVLVESPHIDKIYGPVADKQDSTSSRKLLYEREQPDAVFFFNMDWTRASDIMMVVATAYIFVQSFTIDHDLFSYVHSFVWQAARILFIGTVLHKQSNHRWWTTAFSVRGGSTFDAFQSWKRLYNFFLVSNIAVFLGTSARAGWRHYTSLEALSMRDYACIVIGIVLLSISYWSFTSAYSTIGDYGWFYGDFFLPLDVYQSQVVYTGVYRFLNNPQTLIGYIGYHGIALIVQNWSLFIISLTAQLMDLVLVRLVEIPHMNRTYAQDWRERSPWDNTLFPAVEATLAAVSLRENADEIRRSSLAEIHRIYTSIHASKAVRGVEFDAPSVYTIGSALEFTCASTINHAERSDWVGLYDVNVPSAPTLSRGCWVYVGTELQGTYTLPEHRMPCYPGVFELRYHINNSYKVAAVSAPILVLSNGVSQK